jgi:hypothetical protein
MTAAAEVEARLTWLPDRLLLDDLVFRLEHFKSSTWEIPDHFFAFFKTKALVDQYFKYLSQKMDFSPRSVFELGIFDGGSTAFWFELFRPSKHVAIDLVDGNDSDYFQQYRASRNAEHKIKTFWTTNQADRERLRRIVSNEFDGPLDLVIDDASHLYAPTKASFEILFPLLRKGGIYIIEDWAWAHWKEFHSPEHEWTQSTPLTKLISELVEATGSSKTLISNVTVFEGFAAIERGTEEVNPGDFCLERHIVSPPRGSAFELWQRRFRRKVRSISHYYLGKGQG